MQTRSQTRKLLLDPQNVMFEIPVSRETPRETPRLKASTRVLPDSIKNGPSTPINCALFLPKYMQKPLYDVDINFDEASEAWRANKISIGNGQYKYKGTRSLRLTPLDIYTFGHLKRRLRRQL